MKNSCRTDLACEKKKYLISYHDNDIKVLNTIENNSFYKTIYFSYLKENKIKKILKKELLECIKKYDVNLKSHFFIIGLGNDNHTADSIGPKCLKYIKATSFLENLGVTLEVPKISSLEPGVLGETGIETKRIIESVVNEIKPDFIILIDSYVTSDIKYLNQCIQFTNEGIAPGSGLKGIQSEISFQTFCIPILVIGVPTAIEARINNQTYFLSTKDIDEYVIKISKIIGETINDVLYYI